MQYNNQLYHHKQSKFFLINSAYSLIDNLDQLVDLLGGHLLAQALAGKPEVEAVCMVRALGLQVLLEEAGALGILQQEVQGLGPTQARGGRRIVGAGAIVAGGRPGGNEWGTTAALRFVARKHWGGF